MRTESYTAHESFWTDVKMMLSMLRLALFFGFLVQFTFIAFSFFTMNTDVFLANGNKLPHKIFLKYHTNHFGNFDRYNWQVDKELLPYAKGWSKLPAKTYNEMADYVTGNAYLSQKEEISSVFRKSFLSYIVSVIYLMYFYLLSKQRQKTKYVRGAQMRQIDILNSELKLAAQENQLSILKIGETIIPFEMESKHMLILGTAGSGKGVLLNQLINQINKRKLTYNTGERCIFYDLKGEFVSKQYKDGDYIFSPFDARSIGWNIFNEIETLPDFDIIAKSLFISPDEKNAYWYNCAGDVFKSGLIYLKSSNQTSNKQLWNFFSMPLANIKAAFATLPLEYQGATKHIDKEDAPASASIISILQERIQFFLYLTDLDGTFSFRKYIREQANDKVQPNLFILNIEQYSTIFKPLMTLVIDAMIREALSLPDNLNRRIWFIIDELGTLYKMESIIKLETVGRSKGGCLVCANQDLGRIEEMYGKANLKSFFNNFNTNFTFRIREPETAEFLSKAIGDQQIIKTSQSRQISPNEIGDRRSESDQEKTERLVMPVEFQSLQDLQAIVNIAGFGVATLNIPKVFFKETNESFIMRDFKDIELMEVARPDIDEALRQIISGSPTAAVVDITDTAKTEETEETEETSDPKKGTGESGAFDI